MYFLSFFAFLPKLQIIITGYILGTHIFKYLNLNKNFIETHKN